MLKGVLYKKTTGILCAILILYGMLTSCEGASMGTEQLPTSDRGDKKTETLQTDREQSNPAAPDGNSSGTVFAEPESIPDGYTSPAAHAGTLEKLTYDTWESFTYEQKTQKLTKEAWVYLPYGYTEEQKYNVMYISHGGWSNETTVMGTDANPRSFKYVIDHAIEDGKIQPLITVCAFSGDKPEYAPLG